MEHYVGVGCGLDVVPGFGPGRGCGFLFGCPAVGRASGSVAALAWGFNRWVGA